MRCPQCQSRELQIDVVLSGPITFRFESDQNVVALETGALDSFWGPEANCACIACGWTSVAAMAADGEDDFLRMLPYADQQLASVRRILDEGDCPAPVAARLKELCDLIRRQTELLQSLHRVTAAAAKSVDRKHSKHPRRDPMGAEGSSH